MNILENIQTALIGMPLVELISVITAIIYVVLAARKNIWCWLFGIISSIFWTYAAYQYYQLYVDALLQIYYVAMGVYGWYSWNRGFKLAASEQLAITKMKNKEHIQIIVGGILLTVLVGYFFKTYTAAVATYLDAFTTVFAIITTVLVARKKLENWIYWIVIDLVYVYLYGSRGGYLFAALNVIYIVVAYFGYLNWRKEINEKVLTT